MIIVGILIAIGALLGIVSSRLVTVFFHELGHAIPALLFTKDKVYMYVGSYGSPKKALAFGLGRLKMNLSFNIWELRTGLCGYSKTSNRWQNLIIIFGGPFMSLITAGILLYLMNQDYFTDGNKFVLGVFFASALVDFFVNIIPDDRPAKLPDGQYVYNDGMQLKILLSHQRKDDDYTNIYQLIQDKKIQDARFSFDALTIDQKSKSDFLLLELILLNAEGEIDEFIQKFEKLDDQVGVPVELVITWAKNMILKHKYDEVINVLTKLITLGKGNYDFHFLRGKALVGLSEYRDALYDFNALTLGDKIDPKALANRAYCQFRLGYKEEAREDVLHAVNLLGKQEGEVYFLAGQIFEDFDESKALEYYRNAKNASYQHHALDFQLSRLEGEYHSKN